jgi:hypothetical protein
MKKGLLVLLAKLVITEYDKYEIVVSPLSKDIFKIIETDRSNGTVTLSRGFYKEKKIDNLERYLFPYIKTEDDELYPLSKDWQRSFDMSQVNRMFFFSVSTENETQFANIEDRPLLRKICFKGKAIDLLCTDKQYDVLMEVSRNNQ